jgi:1-deoxy-D-xylulose-5-phosphate reductoisomerase
VLNAANEVAVAAFLDGRIGFTSIAEVIDRCLQQLARAPESTGIELEQILAVDDWARREAEAQLAQARKRALHG